jgi:hypothetical protein
MLLLLSFVAVVRSASIVTRPMGILCLRADHEKCFIARVSTDSCTTRYHVVKHTKSDMRRLTLGIERLSQIVRLFASRWKAARKA